MTDAELTLLIIVVAAIVVLVLLARVYIRALDGLDDWDGDYR